MLLQIEGHSPFNQPRKTRSEPKDHVRENVRRMRQIQKASRLREEDRHTPVKALWKSTKYEGIPSKVKNDLQNEPPPPRSRSADFLRAHSRTGFIPARQRPPSTEVPDCSSSLSVPSAESARDVKLKRRDVDFVKLNGISAKHSVRRSPSLSALDDVKTSQTEDSHERGAVPKYLQSRKEQWDREEQERIASIPDPDLPPGHRIMPTAERLQTLEKLKVSEQELLCQMNSMPIRSDTPRMRARKSELDSKLAEIDEAIKIFSRMKVFVKMDA